MSTIGIDSRIFIRNTKKKDGSLGHFESVLGVGIKVRDYSSFNQQYQNCIKQAFSSIKLEPDYQYYCYNDIKENINRYKLLENFAQSISKHIEKVYVFYTLFSKKRLSEVLVYGRKSRRERIKLSVPTRSYEDLIKKNLLNYFPAICAWRLMQYFLPETAQFHIDSYGGHICEAHEELYSSEFKKFVYTHGDCSNSVISSADLILALLDYRLEINNKFLIFDNIRPAIPEFNDNVLVYPILNWHLPKITPIDDVPINTLHYLKHPVFWVFKSDELLESGTVKRSEAYRSLVDYAANYGGIVKMFQKGKDIDYFQEGDYGVYVNSQGKETIESYKKLGKKFKLFNIDNMVKSDKNN